MSSTFTLRFKRLMSCILVWALFISLLPPLAKVEAASVDEQWKAMLLYNPQTQSFKSFTNVANRKHSHEDYAIVNYDVEQVQIEFNLEKSQFASIELYRLKDDYSLRDEQLIGNLAQPFHSIALGKDKLLLPGALDQAKSQVLGEHLGTIVDASGKTVRGVYFEGYSGQAVLPPEPPEIDDLLDGKSLLTKLMSSEEEGQEQEERVEEGQSVAEEALEESAIELDEELTELDEKPIEPEEEVVKQEAVQPAATYEFALSAAENGVSSYLPDSLKMQTILWDGKVEKNGNIDYPNLPDPIPHPDGQDEPGYVPCVIVVQPLGSSPALDNEPTERFLSFMGVMINPFAPLEQLGHGKKDLKGIVLKADPINMLNGNFVWSHLDLSVAAKYPLEFTRHYNAQDKNKSELGYGWRHSFSYDLAERNYWTSIQLPDGEKITFNLLPDGTFHSPSGSEYRLVKQGGLYTLADETGWQYVFNGQKKLSHISYQGQTIYTLRYSSDVLIAVEGQGTSLTLTYDAGKLAQVSDPSGRSVRYSYDAQDNLITMTNPDSASMTFGYDDRHNITTISDLNGQIYLTNTYDTEDRVTKQEVVEVGTYLIAYNTVDQVNTVTELDGSQTKYYVDKKEGRIVKIEDEDGGRTVEFANGNITRVVDMLGRETNYDYDNQWRLTTTIFPDQTSEQHEYNPNGLLTRIVFPDHSTESYTYDSRGNLLSVTDARGNKQVYSYDANNHRVTSTDALGNMTRYEYDAQGNIVKMIDPLGGISNMVYDKAGNLLKQTTPEGNELKIAYSPAGKPTELEDVFGNKTKLEYTASGELLQATDALHNVTTIEYDKMNRPLTVSTPDGNTIHYTYDNKANIFTTTDAQGSTVTEQYDQKWNLLSEIDPLGNQTSYTYDAEGQLVKERDAAGNEIDYGYDVMGRLVSEKNSRGATYTYHYDTMGREIERIDPLNNRTRTEYDKNGNITKQIDPNGNPTHFAYDKENRLTTITNAAGDTTNITYDSLGRATSYTNTENGTEQIAYNLDGKPIKRTDALGFETAWYYDQAGRLVRKVNADGTSVQFEYDEKDRVVRILNEDEEVFHYTYDYADRLLTEKDPLDGETTYTYTPNGWLSSETAADGGVTTYDYDANGQLLEVIDPEGGRTSFGYDALGRIQTVTDPRHSQLTIFYDEASNIVETVFEDGGKRSYTYDLMDRLVSETDEADFEETREYDANGNVTKVTDARGFSQQFTYDRLNQLVQVEDPTGAVESYRYNKEGQLQQVTDAEGAVTKYQYDAAGQLSSITDALGHARTYSYDALGRLIKETDERGNATQYAYNHTGNISQITDPFGATTMYRYDRLGRMVEVIDPENGKRHYTYDALGRVLHETDENGHKQFLEYDRKGRVTSVKDRNGQTLQYAYDENDNVTAVTDTLGNRTELTYDARNRLIQMDRHQVDDSVDTHQQTIYVYDKRGLVTKKITPLGEETNLQYDENGNLVEQIDADGYVTAFEYSETNQLLHVNYNHQKQVTLAYTKAGELREVRDWNGTTQIEVDPLGRIQRIVDFNQRQLAYEYDQAGNLSKLIYPDQSVLEYGYDKANRLTHVLEQDGSETRYSYDRMGRLIEQAFPSGELTKHAYNRKSQLVQTIELDKDGVTRRHYEYNYDDEGNRIKTYTTGIGIHKQQETTYYRYDELNRLIEKKFEGETTAYVYDSLGNLIEEQSKLGTTTYQYNKRNQLMNKTAPDGVYTYRYDKRGNLLEEQKDHSTLRSYVFDATNRLELGTNQLGEQSRYKYNGVGMRVRTEQLVLNRNLGHQDGENSRGSSYIGSIEDLIAQAEQHPEKTWTNDVGTTRQTSLAKVNRDYLHDWTSPYATDLMVFDEQGYQQRFVFGLSKIAQETTHIPGHTEPGNEGANIRSHIAAELIGKLYVHEDLLGSPAYFTKGNGQIFAYAQLDEWGKPLTPEVFGMNYSGLDKVADYTGHTYDRVLEQYFAQARMYDPVNKRFISEDTYKGELEDPLSLHRYAYVHNNPLIYIDPSGNKKYPHPEDSTRMIEIEDSAFLEELRIQLPHIMTLRDNSDEYWKQRSKFGKAFRVVYNDKNNNQFKYLYGLLTQTSPSGNSNNKAEWARQQLIADLEKYHVESEIRKFEVQSMFPIPDPAAAISGGKASGGSIKSGSASKSPSKPSVSTTNTKVKNDSNTKTPSNNYKPPSSKNQTSGGSFSKGCNCFTAGTRVLTDEGEKNIEDIEVGDRVLAKSEFDANGELAYKEVTALYRNQRDDIIKLHVGEQVIETTDNHPFWVEGKGWVFADELQVGDKLQKADGSNLTIDKVEFVKLDEPVTVYNFTVADFHTYYVTDIGIWVHNTDCPNPISVSDSKMYQLGDHFNKHGRGMGYASKKEYDAAAKEFANTYQKNPNATILEGTWNGPGTLNGARQRAITYGGKTVVIDVKSGQVVDFFTGTEYKGINVTKLQ